MSLKEATEQTSSKEEVVAYKIHGVNVNVAPSEKNLQTICLILWPPFPRDKTPLTT